MSHLPALCAAYPSFCWTWVTNMEPATRRYSPGWFHIGISQPHDGDTRWVGGEYTRISFRS